jgi:hypothetical protein
MDEPTASGDGATKHSQRSGAEFREDGRDADEGFYDSSSCSADDEEDIGDVNMEDLLDIEGELPLETDNTSVHNSPYSSADWLGPRRPASPTRRDATADYPAPLSLYPSPPTPEESARMAREERKRRIREEDQRMRSFGFKYVVVAESPGEAELSCHPYYSRYRVRERSLLRSGWFLDKEDDAHHSEDEWEVSRRR